MSDSASDPNKSASKTASDIDIDLSQNPAFEIKTGRVPAKEKGARWIATVIVFTFAGSIGLTIILGFSLLFCLRWAPDKVEPIFTKGVIPFMEKVGTFATTVYGPLLAFILGYYFGEKNERNAKS